MGGDAFCCALVPPVSATQTRLIKTPPARNFALNVNVDIVPSPLAPLVPTQKSCVDLGTHGPLRPREREDREPAGPSALAALHGRSGKPFWSSTSVGTQVSPIARVYNQAKLACRAAESHGKIWGVGLMGVLNEQ